MRLADEDEGKHHSEFSRERPVPGAGFGLLGLGCPPASVG